MSEKKSVITGKEIVYEGIFSLGELFGVINNLLGKRSYSRKIGLNAETVKPTGKFIKTNNTFKRVINEYSQYHIIIEYQIENLKEVEVVREGRKLKMNKGKIMIEIHSFVITDYENYWEGTPLKYFFRRILDKFFLGDETDKWVSDVKRDVGDLVTEITTYFNFQEHTK